MQSPLSLPLPLLSANLMLPMSPASRFWLEASPNAHPPTHPAGTTVEARDLFLNLPVRRGFLGSERAETRAH